MCSPLFVMGNLSPVLFSFFQRCLGLSGTVSHGEARSRSNKVLVHQKTSNIPSQQTASEIRRHGTTLRWPCCTLPIVGPRSVPHDPAADQRWSNAESGKEVTIDVGVGLPKQFVGWLSWAVSLGDALVARGEAAIAMMAGQNKTVAIKFIS